MRCPYRYRANCSLERRSLVFFFRDDTHVVLKSRSKRREPVPFSPGRWCAMHRDTSRSTLTDWLTALLSILQQYSSSSSVPGTVLTRNPFGTNGRRQRLSTFRTVSLHALPAISGIGLVASRGGVRNPLLSEKILSRNVCPRFTSIISYTARALRMIS